MRVDGIARRTIRADPAGDAVWVIDQRLLPHHYVEERLATPADVQRAIAQMWVRGAPLIGVTAAYGMALQCRADASDGALAAAKARLDAARPTAVNLAWATARMLQTLRALPVAARTAAAWREAAVMADEDVAVNAAIGRHGEALLRELQQRLGGRRLNLLTHCNAGWLATVDWGTATAPVYRAHAAGLPLHVWVDETRPRNQGASLTAWELAQEGVAHTLVADNSGGHLMQRGLVDAVIVGTDRVSARGDVANKIGTYLKALAAHDNGVPFYVAMPLSSLDLTLEDGASIPIEERPAREVTHVAGLDATGRVTEVCIAPAATPAANPAFDVTPARLVTGLITERGLLRPEAGALRAAVGRPPPGATGAA
jgi:methylthioribose-1-phosphate isomerase